MVKIKSDVGTLDLLQYYIHLPRSGVCTYRGRVLPKLWVTPHRSDTWIPSTSGPGFQSFVSLTDPCGHTVTFISTIYNCN